MNFTDESGFHPYGSLMEASDGKLYGMNAEDWSLDRSLFKRPGDVQGKLF